jgi:hypothetical protein
MKKTSQLQNEKFYTYGMYIDLNGMSVEEYMNASKGAGGSTGGNCGDDCECVEVFYGDEELNNQK